MLGDPLVSELARCTRVHDHEEAFTATTMGGLTEFKEIPTSTPYISKQSTYVHIGVIVRQPNDCFESKDYPILVPFSLLANPSYSYPRSFLVQPRQLPFGVGITDSVSPRNCFQKQTSVFVKCGEVGNRAEIPKFRQPMETRHVGFDRPITERL